MATVAEELFTAEQFASMPDPGYPTELVRGRIIKMPPPSFRHGQVCNKVGRIIGNYSEDRELGHVIGNDSGVVTERGPDSVRGPDVAFFSYARIPKDRVIEGYPDVMPELVFEVRSPRDRWSKILGKVAEYLEAGTLLVCVLDPRSMTAHNHRPDGPDPTLGPDDEWSAPEILPGFSIRVRKFFE